MRAICFFNNKGGVGKTTLVANVASFLAERRKKRILLVDADPQSNASQLILSEAAIRDFYRPSRKVATRARRRSSRQARTLFEVLEPVAAGEPDINSNILPYAGEDSRFGIDLLPGHPQVAMLEDKLSQAWLSFGGGDLGGARISNWNTQLRAAFGKQYGFIFYDDGPSLGALNRSVLIGVDSFVVPMGCDIFSILGVENIAAWLRKWLAAYDDALQKCKQTWEISDYAIQPHADAMSRFVGYTIQQYITKRDRAGERRPTKAFEHILKQIPSTIDEMLGGFTDVGLAAAALKLPDIPQMYSLVPLAQSAHAPIHGLAAADGLVGAQYQQKVSYEQFIEELSDSPLVNISK